MHLYFVEVDCFVPSRLAGRGPRNDTMSVSFPTPRVRLWRDRESHRVNAMYFMVGYPPFRGDDILVLVLTLAILGNNSNS